MIFVILYDKLGEDVGVVVVLKEGHDATEREICDFASAQLAAFKVFCKIMILNDILKGAIGKLQCIGLVEKLGLV